MYLRLACRIINCYWDISTWRYCEVALCYPANPMARDVPEHPVATHKSGDEGREIYFDFSLGEYRMMLFVSVSNMEFKSKPWRLR